MTPAIMGTDRIGEPLRQAVLADGCFGRMVGASPEMRRLYPRCQRLAATDVHIIVVGETGTGKEVLAESLHEESPRASGPFVVFDCAAVAPKLIESELFGHERGAFFGAASGRAGALEEAHGGTLFVDEIGDMDPMLQSKLFRAIQHGQLHRVGGDQLIKFDTRVIVASRRYLVHELKDGGFRDDVFCRLAFAQIELPPLRNRHGDIAVLMRHFVAQLGGHQTHLLCEVPEGWEAYGWPGNVRELRNAVVRRLVLGELAEDPELCGFPGADLPSPPAEDFLDQLVQSNLPFTQARDRILDEVERRLVAYQKPRPRNAR